MVRPHVRERLSADFAAATLFARLADLVLGEACRFCRTKSPVPGTQELDRSSFKFSRVFGRIWCCRWSALLWLAVWRMQPTLGFQAFCQLDEQQRFKLFSEFQTFQPFLPDLTQAPFWSKHLFDLVQPLELWNSKNNCNTSAFYTSREGHS